MKRPLPNLGNLGVVDLDLVDGMRRHRGSDEQDCRKWEASSEAGQHFDTRQRGRLDPIWLTGIFLLIPGLNFLLILGLYGFYLLWVGLPMLMKVQSDKALPYAAIVTACALIPAIVLTMI